MIYLSNIFLLLYILFVSSNILASQEQKIIFSVNNKIYTSHDLDLRKKYLQLQDKFIDVKNNIILEDFVSVILFNNHFQQNYSLNKSEKEKIYQYYENIYSKYELLNDDDIEKKEFIYIGKDKIIENIIYDYQRKIIIEKILNNKKEIIFSKNKLNIDEIYSIDLSYFSVDFDNKDKIKNFLQILDLNNIEETKILLDKKNIKYIYTNKKVNYLDNLNKIIKEQILNNKNDFVIESNNNLIKGKIIKKIKNNKNINFSLFQIKSDKNIDNNLIKCSNISALKKNNSIEIIENNKIPYSNLNNNIKKNLLSINDYIIFKNESSVIYLILCNISFDQEHYDQMYMDEKISFLVDEIEKEFIYQKTKEYNLIIFNE